MTRAFRIAYDGRPFHGFQRQPDVKTVEGVIFDALREFDLLGDDQSKPSGYAAAGRTDKGVSAVAQTIAFDVPDWLSPRALNTKLPDDVRAWASAPVSEGFHATHDAVQRVYQYHLYAPDSILDQARSAASRMSGNHDFHNLTPDATGTVRSLDCTVDREHPFLRITVSAGGFPRQLVRRLVTVVRNVAVGEAKLDRPDRVLGPDPLEGPEGVAPARPGPLVLLDVVYPDLSFEPDTRAARDTQNLFQDRAVRARTTARTFETVTANVVSDAGPDPD